MMSCYYSCAVVVFITEQWKKLSAREPGRKGFFASGIWNSHKTTPCVAARQCCSTTGKAEE